MTTAGAQLALDRERLVTAIARFGPVFDIRQMDEHVIAFGLIITRGA
jgi:hypothetical protein